MIVSDTNLIVYLYVESEFTARALRVHALDPEWVFPPVARSEAANVLSTLVRERWISNEKSLSALEQIEPRISAGSRDVPMKTVLQLALTHAVSAYDAQFVVLAELLGVALVTEDSRLKKRFPGMAMSMTAFIENAGRTNVRESRAIYGTRRKR
ncbi:MAG: type II toxin-antitoxin system VapC family toxin [Kiritimatiellaeota bacterium]|nr:type II toxin-antitoxin system VapC family toxin [Kiritimatiellota bacterium]